MTPKELKELEKTLENLDQRLTVEYIDNLRIALDEISSALSTTTNVTTRTRLNTIKRQITESINEAYVKVDINENSDNIIAETITALALIGIGVALSKAAINRIKSTNTVMPNLGKTLQDTEDETRAANIRKLQGLAAAGIVQGKSVDEIVKDLSAAQTAVNNQHVKTIVRTADSEIFNNTALEAYDASPEVLGFESSAVMDRRTTQICADLNGRRFYKKDGWNRDRLSSSEFAIPRHYNCRSVWLPITNPKGQT